MVLQERIQARCDELVDSGAEVGLQVAVLDHGEAVASVCSGVSDASGVRTVSPTDLFFAASTAKGVLTSLTHVLVARGELTYGMPVARVWPQFAAHGKADVTVRHVLLHKAGVPGLPADLTTEQLCDWDHMCDVIAGATPWWPAGSKMGYHAQTFGFLMGETLQRATGASLGDLLRDGLAGPVGAGDSLFFGVPEHLTDNVVRQYPPDDPVPEPPDGSPAAQAMPPGARPDADFANRRDVLSAHIPSMGTMSALGVAQMYAGLLGYLNGVDLVPAGQIGAAAQVAFDGHDEVMDMSTRWALGYSVDRPGQRASRPGSTFGMLGSNGSAAYADIDSGVAVAVLRNRFSPDFTAAAAIDDLVTEHSPQPPEEH